MHNTIDGGICFDLSPGANILPAPSHVAPRRMCLLIAARPNTRQAHAQRLFVLQRFCWRAPPNINKYLASSRTYYISWFMHRVVAPKRANIYERARWTIRGHPAVVKLSTRRRWNAAYFHSYRYFFSSLGLYNLILFVFDWRLVLRKARHMILDSVSDELRYRIV